MNENLFELGKHTEAIDNLKKSFDGMNKTISDLCIGQKTLTGEVTLALKAMRETAEICKEGRKAAELALREDLDKHINIDHIDKLEYANWFCTIKKHSIKIVIGLLALIGNLLFPDYSYGFIIDIFKKIFS